MKGSKAQVKNKDKDKSKAPKDDKKKKQQPVPELPEKKNKQKIDELKVQEGMLPRKFQIVGMMCLGTSLLGIYLGMKLPSFSLWLEGVRGH